jgi:hypothetical protein
MKEMLASSLKKFPRIPRVKSLPEVETQLCFFILAQVHEKLFKGSHF